MDYLLFSSQFSPSSNKLIEEFPALREKVVSVDSTAMRVYVKKIHIVCVPTLVIFLGKRIVDRVVGYDSIVNWLMTTLYRMDQLQSQSTAVVSPSLTVSEPEMSYPVSFPSNELPSVTTSPPSTTTSLDDLILEDVPAEEHPTPHVQTGMSANTMLLAEALKKERDNSLDSNTNKKKFV